MAVKSGGCGGLKHIIGAVSGPTVAALRLQVNPITALCPNFPSKCISLLWSLRAGKHSNCSYSCSRAS